MSPAFRLLTHSFEPRSSRTTWHARSLEHRRLLPAFFHYPYVTGGFAAHLEVVMRIKRNFADRVFGRVFVRPRRRSITLTFSRPTRSIRTLAAALSLTAIMN